MIGFNTFIVHYLIRLVHYLIWLLLIPL